MPVFLERFILPLLAAIVVIVAVTNPIDLSLRDRAIATPILLGLAAVAAYGVHRSLHATQGRRRIPRSTPERTYIDVKPRFLMCLYRKNSILQADRLLEPYVGSWLRVRGRFYQVSNNYGNLAAFIYPQAFHLRNVIPYMYLMFDQEWLSRLSALKLGRKITVDGKIKWADRNSVSLELCELVEED